MSNEDNLFIYFTLYPDTGVAGIIPNRKPTCGYLECDGAKAFYTWGRQDGWAEYKGFTAYIDTGKVYEPRDSLNDIIMVTRNGIQYGAIKSEIPMPIKYCDSKRLYMIPKINELPVEKDQITIDRLPESLIWFKFEKIPHEKPDWEKKYVYTEVTSTNSSKPLGDFNACIHSQFPRDWLLSEKKSTSPTLFEYVYELTDMEYDYRIPQLIHPIEGLITPRAIYVNNELFDTTKLIEMKPVL